MNGDFWATIGQNVVTGALGQDDSGAQVIYLDESDSNSDPGFWASLSNGEKIAAAGVGLALVALIVRR